MVVITKKCSDHEIFITKIYIRVIFSNSRNFWAMKIWSYTVHVPCALVLHHTWDLNANMHWTSVSRSVACIRWRPLPSNTDRFCVHGQKLHRQLLVWLTGMANRKRTICSACKPCYVIWSEHKFFTIFDCLVVLTDCSDAEMSRSSDFCANRWQTKPIALPLAHVHGKNIAEDMPIISTVIQCWGLKTLFSL